VLTSPTIILAQVSSNYERSIVIENLLNDIETELVDNNTITVQPLEPINQNQNIINKNENDLNNVINPNSRIENKQTTEQAVNNDYDIDGNIREQQKEDINTYGYNKEVAENSIGIEISVRAQNMRSARISSIDEAIKFAATEYAKSINEGFNNQIINSIINNHIGKVLIVDESFNSNTQTYEGYFDVWLQTEEIKKSIFGVSRNESVTINGPEWVLIIPSIVTENNEWGLAGRNDEWANIWQIPSSIGKTQLISTRGDADDREKSRRSNSMYEFVEYLKGKYNANNILFSSFEPNKGEIQILYWDSNSNNFQQFKQNIIDDSISYENAKELSKNLFLKALLEEKTIDNQSGYSEESGSINNNFIKYITIGNPKPERNGFKVNLQIIKNRPGITFDRIDMILRGSEFLDLISYKDQEKSILINLFIKNIKNISDIDTILKNENFIPY
jgi:hypothetical protein